MHARLFTSLHPRSNPHLQSWDRYREMELTANKQLAVTDTGDLLEYETLVSRLLPPNVKIDNEMYEDKTVLIVDSANRPGTLVEVVQCLTELGLSVKQARISSDGGWFVDEFHVSETPSGRVTDPKKVNAIKNMLSLPEHTGEPAEVHTVFQIAGPETPGLLAEITELLSHNGLEIRTAAAWTYHSRAAIVIGVTERNAPVGDRVKLNRLRQLLVRLVERQGDAAVSVEQVEGPVHHERRLHQLLLADEVHAWKQLSRLQRQHSLPFPAPIHTSPSAAAAAAGDDADADVDQNGVPHTPKTPRQQWQRRMLPPQWTVDQRGKPVHRERSTDATAQQQMQQRHLGVQQAAAAAAAAEQAERSVVHSNSTSFSGPDGAAAALHVVQAEGLQLPVEAAVSKDGGIAARDAAAVAAAAAQQASVDKLIALLQPPPLAHMTSFPAVRQQQQQQAGKDAAAGRGSDQAAAGSSSTSIEGQSSVAEQQQQQKGAGMLRSVTEPQSELLAAVSAASNLSTAASAAGAAHAASGTASTNHTHMTGLPPRPPSVLATHMPLPPGQQQQQQQQQQQSYSSASAPSSPAAPKASRSAGIAGTGLAPLAIRSASATSGHSAASPFSPGRLASAAAAAGQLSPRGMLGLSGAATAPHGSIPTAAGGAGGMSGLQQQQQGGVGGGDLGTPEVQIQHSSLFNYWLVTIRCRDRNKLFFDTVCTLCDMRYDIFHATIDGEPSGWAQQLFYIRPRFGECVWDERRASVLQAMLVSAVQRRFPPGLRVHVFSGSNVVLQDLVNAMKRHKLTITRCKVRAFESSSHTFSLLNQDGSLPSRQYVQMACQSAGGELVEAPLDLANPCVATVLRSLDARGRFAFSFVNLRAYKLRGIAPAGAAGRDLAHARYPAGDAALGSAAAGLSVDGSSSSGHNLFGDHHAVFGGGGIRPRQGALAVARPAAGGGGGGIGGGSSGGASYNSDNHPSF